jgi:hypothetical protein
VSALSFYRAFYGRDDLPKFVGWPISAPPGGQVYVLDLSSEQKALAANHLRVVYLGELSEIVVAIDPRLEPRQACPAPTPTKTPGEPGP